MSTNAVVPAASAPQPSNIVTLKRAIQYAADHISPPSYLHIQQEDDIVVKIFAPTIALPFSVNVEFRVLYPADATHPEAEIRPTRKQVLVNATSVTLRFNLNEGFILSASASLAAGATANRGQVFVQMFVVRGIAADLITLWTLLSDYVTTNFRPTWPNAGPRHPLEGPGFIRGILGTDPPAGSEIIETVPNGARWKLLSFRAVLVTDATAPARTARMIFRDGGTLRLILQPSLTQAASTTGSYDGADLGYAPVFAPLEIEWRIPHTLTFLAGNTIETNTTAIAGGDNWSAPNYYVEEWADI